MNRKTVEALTVDELFDFLKTVNSIYNDAALVLKGKNGHVYNIYY